MTVAPSELSRPQLRTRPALLGVLLAAGLASAVVAPPSRATEVSGVSVIGEFTPTIVNPAYGGNVPYTQDVRLAVDPAGRLLFTIDQQSPAFIAAYDLDSLAPVSRRGVSAAGGVSAWLRDSGEKRVLVATGGSGATTGLQAIGVRAGSVAVLGTMPLSATDLGGPSQTVIGLARQPGTPYAYLLSAMPDGSGITFVPRTVNVTLVDLSGLTQGRGRVVAAAALPDCVMPLKVAGSGAVAGFGYARGTRSLYLGCSSPQPGNVAKTPVPVGVGRLPVGTAAGRAPAFGAFELFPFPGDVNGSGVWDPRTQRLLVKTTGNSTTTVYTFDPVRRSYVGGVGMSLGFAAAGVDDENGRLYLLSTHSKVGLRAVDTGATPVDQGHGYPELSSYKGQYLPRVESTIATDGRTGRLWLPYRGHFVVARDNVPRYMPPIPPDPDRATMDIPETPGRTGADFTAAAQAYGAVYRQVGGTANLQYNVVPIDLGVSPVGSGTRELSLAYLDKLSLDNDTASGGAIGADRDRANTQADEQHLPAGSPGWPYQRVSCSDFGGVPKTASADGAVVRCDAARHEAVASAVGDSASAAPAGSAAPVIAVGRSGFSAVTRRTLASGVTSTVTADARGITVLGGVLRIGDVQVVAEAHAHGRPGTAGSTFKRVVRRVELNGTALCAAECDPETIAATVNAALPGRVRIDFPLPDKEQAAGSPGGFQAVVQRAVGEQIESVQLNQQPKNRLEVPGMVITVFQDNTTPSRTIAFLAGAAVEARYGIYELSQDRPLAEAAGPRGGAVPGVLGGPLLTGPGAAAPRQVDSPIDAPVLEVPDAAAGGAVAAGLRLLLNGVGRATSLLAVWIVLLVPVYLSARRWLMLRRGALDEGST